MDASDRHGQTPLFFAPNKEICKLLVDHKAEVGVVNRKGQTALHLAGRAGLQEVLAWLSARSSRELIDVLDHHGHTARQYAQQVLASSSEGPSGGNGQASPFMGSRSSSGALGFSHSGKDDAVRVDSAQKLEESHAGEVWGASKQRAEEFQMFEEPEQFNLSAHSDTESQQRQFMYHAVGAAALEAAAQVASAAVASAAETMLKAQETWPVTEAETGVGAEELPVQKDLQRGHQSEKLADLIDESW